MRTGRQRASDTQCVRFRAYRAMRSNDVRQKHQEAITGVRRVVTGHSAEGKAVVATDEVIEPIRLALLPGSEFVRCGAPTLLRRFPMPGRCRPTISTFRRPEVGIGLRAMLPWSLTS